MNIYLAGGMRPRTRTVDGVEEQWSWQDAVKAILETQHHKILDPRDHKTKVFEEYTFLDLLRIHQCDVVIAYLELENPSGMGLAVELGYARGLGKRTILINEKYEDRYATFTEKVADIVFHTFEDALPFIGKL